MGTIDPITAEVIGSFFMAVAAEMRATLVKGPAIVEEMDATTAILPGQRATVDTCDNPVIIAETMRIFERESLSLYLRP